MQPTHLHTLNFKPIDLTRLESAALQQRVEQKFLLSIAQAIRFLEEIERYYHCLEIDGLRQFDYRTIYYDTEDLRLYHDHHNGYMKRIKVRARQYENSGLCFFETKQKISATRTQKVRRPISKMQHQLTDSDYQLIVHPHLINQSLEVKLTSLFSRITLCDYHISERVTIDADIRMEFEDAHYHFDKMVVVEIKQSRFYNDSQAIKILRSMYARAVPFSKYVIGKAILHPHLKQNNFKPLLQLLKKYNYA